MNDKPSYKANVPSPAQEATPLSTVLNPNCRVNEGIFIKQNDYHKKFLFQDIHWLEASGNYCYLHLGGKKKILVIQHLYEIENILPDDIFIRIHRSYIINIHAVEAFIGNILCIGEARLTISAPYRHKIWSCFNILDAEKVCFRSKRQRTVK